MNRDTMSAYRQAEHRRRLRSVAGAAAVSGALAVLAAVTRWLDPWHALTLACVIVSVVGLAKATEQREDDPQWPRHTEAVRAGGRHDVSDLGWSTFGRDGLVTDRVVDRVREIARARLRVLGVDPSDPAQQAEIERLLGPAVVAGLSSRTPPTARTLQTWLDAIDRLAAPHPTDATPHGNQRGTHA
ncbi:hypothetical protein [Antribacter gilvus]|uniref:hypothetical protein n=1 Tax=Antribacter gilvus TaxID=2304675 RepID=UPI000F78E7DE|nr:hypothetical protein [Antribacter gilvus]